MVQRLRGEMGWQDQEGAATLTQEMAPVKAVR